MLKGIENIILDLGGIIINLNQELTQKAFKQLFNSSFDEVLAQAKLENVFEKYETGEYSTSQFLGFFKNYKQELTNHELQTAWNKMLLDIPSQRIELIKRLAKQYNVYLLSNTNEIHYNFIEEYYQHEFTSGTFQSLFIKAYLSYQIGLRKPSVKIFEFVLNDDKLNPEKTLFIDDSLEHINAALKLGIKAQHLNLDKHETLTNIFNEH
jgi:putative hydrolase of the HAD superfamily